jgi:hypothetical protein
MPTLSTGLKTLDVLKINNSEELVGVIDDVIRVIPEMPFFDATPVPRNEYNTLVIEQYPKVGFRQPEGFAEYEVAKLGQRSVKCEYLDASWTMDRARAEMSDWNKEFALAIQQKTHLQSAFFELAQQLWYGSKNEVNGFNGLLDMVAKANPEMQVDACGTGSGLTSVFAVSTGMDSCMIAWGSEGKFHEGDIVKIHRENPANTSANNSSGRWDYGQDIGGWAGLQVTSAHAFGRIRNISEEIGKTLTDEMLFHLLSKFPAGLVPQAFFMTRRSLEQLRSNRTAVNATGAPAPAPTDVGGVPIIVTDALINNEETLN